MKTHFFLLTGWWLLYIRRLYILCSPLCSWAVAVGWLRLQVWVYAMLVCNSCSHPAGGGTCPHLFFSCFALVSSCILKSTSPSHQSPLIGFTQNNKELLFEVLHSSCTGQSYCSGGSAGSGGGAEKGYVANTAVILLVSPAVMVASSTAGWTRGGLYS